MASWTAPRTREAVEDAIRRHFPEDADVLVAAMRPGITFVDHGPVRDQGDALWLGGEAPLPADIVWPANGDRDLYFIGGVDLSVAGPLDVTGALPTVGMLLFFFDIPSYGVVPVEADSWRVIWVDDPDAVTLPTRQRQEHDDDGIFVSRPSIEEDSLPGVAVTWTIPYSDERCIAATALTTTHGDAYQARRVDFDAMHDLLNPGFLMLGWPWSDQGGSTQATAAACSSGRDEHDVEDEEAAEWRPLMQFPCWDEYGGTRWGGESGMLHYWIRDEDLRARRFDRTWLLVTT